jgi:hypothetical protein
LPNIRGGSVAASPARRSAPVKTAAATTVTAKAPSTSVDAQPLAGASMSAYTRAPSVTMPLICPVRSSPLGCLRAVSGAIRAVMTRLTRASGTLTRKIARQPTVSVRAPPTTGPAASAAPVIAAHEPTARARSAGSV